jgi:hypothetical protein
MPISNIDNWLKSGRYLPAPLRDFHDQKDVFKTIHSMIDVPAHCDDLAHFNWRASQIYVIDIFLWFMARRGYTLQRVRAKGDFRDLNTDVNAMKEREATAFKAYLKSRKSGATASDAHSDLTTSGVSDETLTSGSSGEGHGVQ